MKKLLVLALVLSMASMASAALQLDAPAEVAKDGSVSISLFAPEADGVIAQGEYYLGVAADSVGDLSFNIDGISIDFAGGPTSAWLSSDYSGDLGVRDNYLTMDIFSIALPPAIPPDAVGPMFSGITITGVTEGLVTLYLFDTEINPTAYEITVTGSTVPEPITIGLLGLGAMFLRRRK